MRKQSPNINQAVVSLGQLILQFARTNRFTFHEDGVTPESDTDHTVMLAILACACAEKFARELDRGKIAQYALVHDLVEVYAKDTPTLRPLDSKEKQAKKEREKVAFDKIENQFGTVFPWITNTIREYDSKVTPEARFVKIIDTMVCKITSILNGAATEKSMNITLEELKSINKYQRGPALSYMNEWPEMIALWDNLSEETLKGLQ